uniref:Putative HAT dimerization domain, Ribonuclease H-like domain protein n=1 Tax=Helianthus annuus TaxID=4232 RepID=A0A251T751_HELAN
MARDFLTIPVSTVASESTFSASGRVLNEHRSSLGKDTVEALICTKDWLYGDYCNVLTKLIWMSLLKILCHLILMENQMLQTQ